MIFQSFSHKRKNKFTPRTPNFHKNRYQRNGPSRNYSHESWLLQKTPWTCFYLNARSSMRDGAEEVDGGSIFWRGGRPLVASIRAAASPSLRAPAQGFSSYLGHLWWPGHAHVSKVVLSKFRLGLNFIDWSSILSLLLLDYELEIIIIAWHILLKFNFAA